MATVKRMPYGCQNDSSLFNGRYGLSSLHMMYLVKHVPRDGISDHEMLHPFVGKHDSLGITLRLRFF